VRDFGRPPLCKSDMEALFNCFVPEICTLLEFTQRRVVIAYRRFATMSVPSSMVKKCKDFFFDYDDA
jgi:hypothetical protein